MPNTMGGGTPGPKGDLGEKGEKGTLGERGLPGNKGERGDSGLAGMTGERVSIDWYGVEFILFFLQYM